MATPDGGEIVLDWMAESQPNEKRIETLPESDFKAKNESYANPPIVVCLHGLSGFTCIISKGLFRL